MHKGMHAGFHVHSPPLLTGYTIFVSLSGMAVRLTLHVVTDFHCALTTVIACSLIAKTHWMSACLLTLYAPACFEHMLQGLEAALTHTILALIRKPKRYVFAHPKNIYGSYWRRIRNRTRRMRRQMLYKYIKTLCKLLSHVQRGSFMKAVPLHMTKKRRTALARELNAHNTHARGQTMSTKIVVHTITACTTAVLTNNTSVRH